MDDKHDDKRSDKRSDKPSDKKSDKSNERKAQGKKKKKGAPAAAAKKETPNTKNKKGDVPERKVSKDNIRKKSRKSTNIRKTLTSQKVHDDKVSDAPSASEGEGKKATEDEGKKVKGSKKRKEEEPFIDPEDDVWTVDKGKVSRGRRYSKSVMGGFKALMYIANYLGLFPLQAKRQKNGTYKCQFSWASHVTILFLFTAVCTVGATLYLLASMISITSNAPKQGSFRIRVGKKGQIKYNTQDLRSQEIFLFKRNAVNIVLIYGSLIHLSICMVAVFKRRHYIAKQITYWTEVVELLQLDVGRGVAKMIFRHLAVIFVFMAGIIALYCVNICPMLASSGSMMYVLFNRPIRPHSHWDDKMKIRKQAFAFFLLYAMISGYVYILWFYYNCRILTNILKIWNNRFQYCLHKKILDSFHAKGVTGAKENVKSSSRTSRAQLFQDHLVIFNLIEGVNTQFQVILESFYLSTMIMMVFEMYGFVHGIFYDEYIKCSARQFDTIPTLLYLMLQFYMYIIVTLEAAGVADEARNVLHIVRRKGMMTARLDNELWFMLSMRLSFGGHEDVGILGAGFFYVTKSFLLGAISAVASHFIMFYQYEVPYSQSPDADPNYKSLYRNDTMYLMLVRMEGVRGLKRNDTDC